MARTSGKIKINVKTRVAEVMETNHGTKLFSIADQQEVELSQREEIEQDQFQID